MPPSEQFQAIAAAMPADFNVPEDDYRTVREKMAPWHGHAIADSTQLEYATFDGVKLAWLATEACSRTDRYALFCHGGGFVSCTMDEYLFFAEHISTLLNCQVVVPDYRLAPEHRFPCALEDCVTGYKAMLSAGVAPNKMFTIGDSCGGGLALATIMCARDQGIDMPAGHIGLTGWYDLELEGVEHGAGAERTEPMITPGWYLNRAADYLGDAPADSPYASTARGDCRELPPLLLQMGSNDLCLPGAQRLASNTEAAGVQVNLEISEGMVHGFHGLVSSGVPEAEAAWQAAKQFLDLHIPAIPA